MKDYFGRQIAYYKGMLDECEAVAETAIGPEAVEQLAARQAENSAGLDSLGAEFRALLKEWQAADDLAESERSAVGRLAAEVEDLGERLSDANERIVKQVGGEVAVLKESWLELRRACGVLDKYRLGDTVDARFIDRKT